MQGLFCLLKQAKLSCLVLKCQERNSLLARMTASMQRRGCEEPFLVRQVQQLLSDATLQDYTAAFSPGRQSWDGRLEFLSKSPHQTFPLLTVQQDQSAFKAPPRGKRRDVESEKQSPSNDAESAKNNKDRCEETTLAARGVLAKDLSSPVPASPVLEGARGLNVQSPVPPLLNEGFISEQVRKSRWVRV